MIRIMQRINNNGTHPACAACKHQRKKCSGNCVLAPYFPANRSKDFQAVHKVFGVSNITKLVKNANEEDRRKVVDSLVWEAYCRQRDPVLGPYGEYRRVYEEYRRVSEELKISTNHSQILQLPSHHHHHQGGVGIKSVQDLIAWNNGSKGMNREEGLAENALSYIHDNHNNTNGIIDSSIYSYHSDYSQDLENLRPELIPFQQHPQPYLISEERQRREATANALSPSPLNLGHKAYRPPIANRDYDPVKLASPCRSLGQPHPDGNTCFFSCFRLLASTAYCPSHPRLLGVHPFDEKYYRLEVIKCKDGSNSFTTNRLRDNFCDCADGTDEPGTSACQAGKFYCTNIGSKWQFIFSSDINDLLCGLAITIQK